MESIKNEGIEKASEDMAKALEKAESPADFAGKIDKVVASFSQEHQKNSPGMVDKVMAAAKNAKSLVSEKWSALKEKEEITAKKATEIISSAFGIIPPQNK
jgi:uncharacterized alpha-E superfamily protein